MDWAIALIGFEIWGSFITLRYSCADSYLDKFFEMDRKISLGWQLAESQKNIALVLHCWQRLRYMCLVPDVGFGGWRASNGRMWVSVPLRLRRSEKYQYFALISVFFWFWILNFAILCGILCILLHDPKSLHVVFQCGLTCKDWQCSGRREKERGEWAQFCIWQFLGRRWNEKRLAQYLTSRVSLKE